MAMLFARAKPGTSLIAITVMSALTACGGAGATSGTAATTPARSVVVQRLATRLESDPNRAVCEGLARELATGNRDAIKPRFDFGSFVERIVARGGLPEPLVAQLRANPSGPENFARYYAPTGSQYRCLGTRTFLGAPHVAIRQWTPTRYDYLLIRLTGRPQLPFDDYHVVSSGFLHSESQAIGFDPSMRASMDIVGAMLQQSFDNDCSGIITAYRNLPPAMQASPVAFFHFINAVYTTEATDSALYRETTRRLEEVMNGREYALAYWQRIDGQRRGDRAAELRARGRLVELLDDYELLER